MADIKSFALTDTAEFTLKHPDTGVELEGADESQPITVTIFGKTSKPWKKVMEAYRKKSLNPPKRPPTAEETRQDNINYFCDMTQSITNMSYNGELVDTPEKIREVYSDESLDWIGAQLQEAIGSISLFLKQ